MKLSVFATAKDNANSAAEGGDGPALGVQTTSFASLSSLFGRQSLGLKKSKSLKSGGAPPVSHKPFKNISHGLSADEKFSRLSTHVFHGISCETPVEEIYELGAEIGKGAFGVVYKAKDRKTGLEFCCKSIRKELLTPEVFDDIKLEAEVMMHLRGHPNIVEIMGLFEDEGHIHIVQELCTGGDLLTKVSKSLEPCSENYAAAITRAVLLVIQHCHSCGVLYRDIKPDNFLLSSNEPSAVLKATDFGISKFMKPGETTDEFMGTPTYMAPEVFNMECGFPSDIWSAGVMLYWLLSGEFPFKGSNKMQLGMQVVQQDPCMEGEGWNEVSNEAKDVINLMLTKDPEERGSVKELLAHKWFKQVSGAKTRLPGNMLLRRLRLYVNMNEFKKEALRRTMRKLDAEYLVGMRAMFNAMNTSESGHISLQELLDALDRQGCKADRKEIESLFKGMDVREAGSLSFEDFGPATFNHSLLEKKGLLNMLFKEFDRKNRDYISQHDLEAALKGNCRVNEKTIQKIMAQVDLNQDGKIDFNEFVVMMFGEDAGLQRLGRGKGNVWSYQNSKDSSGALRDASGQLIKAPNLSNYRKVNNPYSASFMSSSKHPVASRPKATPVILPSTFQKLSSRMSERSAQGQFAKGSDASAYDVSFMKHSSGSGMMFARQSASGSAAQNSPASLSRCGSEHNVKDSPRYQRRSVVSFIDEDMEQRGAAGADDASGCSPGSNAPPQNSGPLLQVAWSPHVTSGGGGSPMPMPMPAGPQYGSSNSSLYPAAMDSRCYSLPEDGQGIPPALALQQAPSCSSDRSSRNTPPSALRHPGLRASAAAGEHGGPMEGHLLQMATDALAARKEAKGPTPPAMARASAGTVSFSGAPPSPGASGSEPPALHRLSVGSHIHSPLNSPPPALRPEVLAAGRVSGQPQVPGWLSNGRFPCDPGSSSASFRQGTSGGLQAASVDSLGGTSMSSLSGGPGHHPLGVSSRYQRQSSNLGPEGGAGATAADRGGSTAGAARTASSTTSGGYSCSQSRGGSSAQHGGDGSLHRLHGDQRPGGHRPRTASAATPGAGSFSSSPRSSSHKYGWGRRGKSVPSTSDADSPNSSQHGRKPAPNISSRQGGPQSFKGMKHSPVQSCDKRGRKAAMPGTPLDPAEQGRRHNKVDHHKGVVDCVIS